MVKQKEISENYQPLISFVSLSSSSGDETNVFVDAVTEDARKIKIRKLKFIVFFDDFGKTTQTQMTTRHTKVERPLNRHPEVI